MSLLVAWLFPPDFLKRRVVIVMVGGGRGCVMWGQGVHDAQILTLVHKFTFKVVLGSFFPIDYHCC